MTKLELVVLDEIPTQVGTEFYIVTLDSVNSCDKFIVNAERERRELEFALLNRFSYREWLKLLGGSVDES